MKFHKLLLSSAIILGVGTLTTADAQQKNKNDRITILEQNGNAFVEAGKAGLRLSFDIQSPEQFDDLNIHSVDICDRPRKCERILKQDLNFTQYGDTIVNFGNVVTEPGEKGSFIRINRDNSFASQNSKLAGRVIHLDEPLSLTEEFRYELILTLDELNPKSKGKIKTYKANEGAGGFVSPSDTNVVLFRPDKDTVIDDVANGFKLILDGNSSDASYLLGYESSRQNLNAGTLFVSPNLVADQPVSLEITFDRPDLDPGTVPQNLSVLYNNTEADLQFIRNDSQGREVYGLSISEPGFLQIDEVNDFDVFMNSSFQVQSNNRLAPLSSTANPCATEISRISATGFYDYIDTTSGGVRFNSCWARDPEVEILIWSNTKIGRPIDYTTSSVTASNDPNAPYNLRTIAQHNQSNSSFAAVNGFLWQGDQGTGAGQVGTALNNFQFIDDQSVGSTVQSNVAAIGFKRTTSGTFPAKFFDLPKYTDLLTDDFNYHLISSTSSIIKNGVCTSPPSSPGPNNLWSAIGHYKSGTREYIVVLSTRTGEKTTPNALCEVFKAFEIDNAIRLDGGPSAAFSINGSHTNPLSWPESWKYGSARRLGSAITFR